MHEKGERLRVLGEEKKKKGCFAYVMLNWQTSTYTRVSPFQSHSVHRSIAKALAQVPYILFC